MAKISISLDQLNTIVTKINSSSDEINKTWTTIKTDEIAKIRASWIGTDAEAYIAKVLEMDAEMTKAIQALKLLATTYTKARESIVQTQNTIKSSVTGL